MSDSMMPASSSKKQKTSPRGVAMASEFVDHEEVKQEAKRQLKALLLDMTAPFCCGGTVELPEIPQVTIFVDIDGVKVPITVVIQPPLEQQSLSEEDRKLDKKRTLQRIRDNLDDQAIAKQPEALAELLANAPAAMFGKGNETVHDESVRSAKQVPAKDFEINIPSQVLDDILVSIRSSLNITTEIVAEPYSLNLYEDGGKFLKHKDTPRGQDVLGTLLLCLPSRFGAGGLTVTKGPESYEFFRRGSRAWQLSRIIIRGGLFDDYEECSEINPRVIPWCALFSDVDHEVHQVYKGVRVTLAYNIRRKDGDSADTVSPQALTVDDTQKTSAALLEKLNDLVADVNFFPEGGKLGFASEHLYTNSDMYAKNTTSKDPLTEKAINKLKGRDLLLARAASDANLKVFIVPFLSTISPNDDSFVSQGESQYLDKFLLSQMRNYDPDVHDYGGGGINEAVADLWVVKPMEEGCARQFVGEHEYFGNSAMETDNYYVRAVLIIEVPPAHERTDIETKKPSHSGSN